MLRPARPCANGSGERAGAVWTTSFFPTDPRTRREVWVLLMRIIDDTSERRGWRVLPLASGMALGVLSACTTPSGELGGVGESASSGASAGETGDGSDGSDTGDDGSDSGDGDSSGGEPVDCEVDVEASGPRLLTRLQYANTIRDVFGVDEDEWSNPALPPWTELSDGPVPFDWMMPGPDTDMAFVALAASAAQAVEPEALLPCAVDTPDPETCAETLVLQMGRAAWRRPLTLEEISGLLVHYDGTDLTEGTRAVTQALMASPDFYTLREQGTPSAEDPGLLVLDDYSLASRLSYFLWNSTPDAALLDLAEAGALSDPNELLGHALIMMADQRARDTVGEMYLQWFDLHGVDQLDKIDPAYDTNLGVSMKTELRMLAGDIVLGNDRSLSALLQAPYTFVDSDLLALYGADVLSTEQPPSALFERAELDPARRGGLLTLPAMMTRYSDADQVGLSRRGMMIRESLLCQLLPAIPAGEDTGLPPGTNRYEYVDELNNDGSCGGCHQLLEGPHFAFDNYDELGRWQEEIDGLPVQTDGELIAVSSEPVTFTGRAELVEELLMLPEVRTCMSDRYLRFALRRPTGEADACTIEQLTDRMVESGDDLFDLMIDIVRSDAFRLVRPQ